MPNWDDVRIFLALHESGTLVGAGKQLQVNHTTVARRLTALERDLGARLFDRTPDGYVATPSGEAIIKAASSMDEQYNALKRQITGQDARLGGVVRLATTETFAAMFVAPWILAAVRTRHPDIDIELVSSASAFDLPRRQADLAIRMTRPAEQDLVTRKLAVLAFGLYGSRAYFGRAGKPPTPDDLAGHDIVGYDRESTFNVGARWLDQASRGMRAAVRCDHMRTVLGAIVAGHGIGVVPCFVADVVPDVERVGAPVVEHDIWLVQHPDLQRTQRIRAVAEIVVEVCARRAPELRGEPSQARPAEPRGDSSSRERATSLPGAGPRYSRPDPKATRRAPGRSRR